MSKNIVYLNGLKWVRYWVEVRGEQVPKWKIENGSRL